MVRVRRCRVTRAPTPSPSCSRTTESSPVAWDPCRVIAVEVNDRLAPAAGARLLERRAHRGQPGHRPGVQRRRSHRAAPGCAAYRHSPRADNPPWSPGRRRRCCPRCAATSPASAGAPPDRPPRRGTSSTSPARWPWTPPSSPRFSTSRAAWSAHAPSSSMSSPTSSGLDHVDDPRELMNAENIGRLRPRTGRPRGPGRARGGPLLLNCVRARSGVGRRAERGRRAHRTTPCLDPPADRGPRQRHPGGIHHSAEGCRRGPPRRRTSVPRQPATPALRLRRDRGLAGRGRHRLPSGRNGWAGVAASTPMSPPPTPGGGSSPSGPTPRTPVPPSSPRGCRTCSGRGRRRRHRRDVQREPLVALPPPADQ